MIALCREHHIQADNGAFTKVQLHDFKKNGKENWSQVRGKFNWMRNRLLAVVGSNFYYETPVIFEFKEQPIIWFERDENDYLLLNLHMLSTSGEARAFIKNNE
ncbi:SEC-C motif domain-containing protein [Halomonas sp. HAL1]|nr:SEC-C motif domain-containing protein [Halomonas sp. HAL1]